MTGASWGVAAVLLLHLGSLGAVPPEVRLQDVRPYLSGERPVRVLIAEGARAVSLRPGAAMVVRDAAGAQVGAISAGSAVGVTESGGQVRLKAGKLVATRPLLMLIPDKPGGGATISTEGGWGRRGYYPGGIEVKAGRSGVEVIEVVELETYVAGVIAAEMPSSFPLEAMKAQAIAARTYALYHLGAHEEEGADLCGEVHCQAYHGQAARSSRAARATRETEGMALSYNGLLVDALYSAACGGETATAWRVRQGKLLPYLIGGTDADEGGRPYCSYDHDVSWGRSFPYAEADRLVRSNLAKVIGEPGARPGRLTGLEARMDPATGRAEWLKVMTARGTYQVRGDSIRWLFGNGRPGPGGLRSTAFELSVKGGGPGRPTAFTFSGRGHGHGIGLCQWGARGRALAGQSAYEILSAYYPDAMVSDLRQ